MDTISTFLGFFNIVSGVMLVGGLLLFFGGFMRYLVVLGTERRNQGLVLMTWGIAILFVLVVLLGIVNTLQGPLAFIVGMGIGIFVCVVIIVSFSKSGGASTSEPER
jgi:hypothetical protein